MTWPNYHFLDLSPAEKQVRRQTLDKYALYAQLSALVPVAFVLLYRLAEWATKAKGPRRGDYDAVPSSPVLKKRRHSGLEVWNSRARRARWWLGEDVVVAGMVLGQRDRMYRTIFFSLSPFSAARQIKATPVFHGPARLPPRNMFSRLSG
jgi:hypothetical protein